MAIKIKRSTGDLAPASLAAGQLAYSEGPNNGGTLYYGEIGGTVREIGGRKYVDKLNGIEAGAQVNTVSSVFGRTGAVTLQSNDVTGALGYTPINPNEKGANNGVATLDAGGKVPSTQLPSYVDDVEEAANLSAFPATGETGKIYVALDTGKTYRWSGSAYVEISASPGSTDSVTEGSTNLYYTDARARAAISVTDAGGDGSLSYNSTSGVFTYTGPSASEVRAHFTAGTGISITNGSIASTITQYADTNARSAISVTDAGGDGSLSYDNSTGVFTYTGPSASEVRAHFSAGTGITITDGVVATTITQYADSNARSAISVTDAGGDGSLSYNSSTGVLTYTGPSASEVRAHFSAGTGITITNGSIATTITQYTDSAARAAISVTDAGGDGSLSYNNSTGVLTYTGPSASEVRAHFSAGTGISITDGVIAATGSGGITDVVQDTTPQLGGDLDVNGNKIKAVSNGNVVVEGHGTGTVSIKSGADLPGVGATAALQLTNTNSGNIDLYTSTAGISIVEADGNAVPAIDINGGIGSSVLRTTNANVTIIDNIGTDSKVEVNAAEIMLVATSMLSVGGVYTLPLADGTAGQVLSTDGAGVVSFVTPFSGDYDDLTNKPTLVTAFTGLSDVPSSYTGQGGKFVRVNSGATGLEFTSDVDDGTF